MSIATTLRLKKALVQPTTLGHNYPHLPQHAMAQMGTARANTALDAVLLIVSEDAVGQNDRVVSSILATTLLENRPYQKHIDQQTQVHVVVRSYAQDPHIGLPMGQRMFRRLLGDRFDQHRMTSTSFVQRGGKSGVIIAQWRSETKTADGAARERQVMHEAARPAAMAPALGDVDDSSMSHWSWWAERSLLK